MQKVKVNGQSVPKIEWKQTDGRTDKRTDGGDCITYHANAVGDNLTRFLIDMEHRIIPLQQPYCVLWKLCRV